MDRSIILEKLFGFLATLIREDTLVLDRWLWLKKRLPNSNNMKLIDFGCGCGAFSIGASLRGYNVLGVSWDEPCQKVASKRAAICKASSVRFEVLDIRYLDSRSDLVGKFDVAICFETIEHILDDKKLMKDIAACLRDGGLLLLTIPNALYRPIAADDGPFCEIENGRHVRKGYTVKTLEGLCMETHFIPERITYCSGFLSQKITFIWRVLSRKHLFIAHLITLPLRIFPPLFDKLVTDFINWPYLSICLEARKPKATS